MYQRDAIFGVGVYAVESKVLECTPRVPLGRKLIRRLKASVRSAQRPFACWIAYLLDLWLETEQWEAQEK